MATNHTLRAVDTPTAPAELDNALSDLCCAISCVKTFQAAIEGNHNLDWAVRDQALEAAVKQLDAAYTRFDLAIVGLNRGQVRP